MCKNNGYIVGVRGVWDHIQSRQIFDLMCFQWMRIWLLGKLKEYRFENRHYSYTERCAPFYNIE